MIYLGVSIHRLALEAALEVVAWFLAALVLLVVTVRVMRALGITWRDIVEELVG